MSDKDSKDLDTLFQMGSEQYDFEYNPDAWGQMETLLEKDKRKRGLIWWWLIGFGILLLLGGIWYYNVRPIVTEIPLLKQAVEKQKIQDKTNNVGQDNQTDLLGSQKPANVDEKMIKKTIFPSSKVETKNDKKGKIPIKKPINQPIVNTIVQTQETIPKITVNTLNVDNEDIKKATENTSQLDVPHLTSVEIETQENNPISSEAIATQTTYLISPISSLPYVYLDIGKKKPVFLEFDQVLSQADHSSFDPFLRIGIVLASEITAVGSDNISKPDFKVGIQIEYNYNRKYSTSIGANYIRKNYEAGKGEYIPPQGFWTRAIAPQSTQGVCNILELPVMIGYYPRGTAQTGFYAKVGLTSYLMLRERYDYSYDLPDSDLKRKWGTRDQTEHWFGIGKFSLGHQKVYKNGMSKQLAAYLQAPLTGIGHGNVKMWSIGMRLVVHLKTAKK